MTWWLLLVLYVLAMKAQSLKMQNVRIARSLPTTSMVFLYRVGRLLASLSLQFAINHHMVNRWRFRVHSSPRTIHSVV